MDNENKTPVILDGKFFEVVIVKYEIVKAICMICKEQKNQKKNNIWFFKTHF